MRNEPGGGGGLVFIWAQIEICNAPKPFGLATAGAAVQRLVPPSQARNLFLCAQFFIFRLLLSLSINGCCCMRSPRAGECANFI